MAVATSGRAGATRRDFDLLTGRYAESFEDRNHRALDLLMIPTHLPEQPHGLHRSAEKSTGFRSTLERTRRMQITISRPRRGSAWPWHGSDREMIGAGADDFRPALANPRRRQDLIDLVLMQRMSFPQ